MNLQNKKFKFLCVGALNTVFGYSVYAGLIFVGLPYFFAIFFATVIGVMFNYYSFGKIVFEVNGVFVFQKFLVLYGAAFLVNSLVIEIVMRAFGFDPYVSQFICIFPVVIFNWLFMNNWVYK